MYRDTRAMNTDREGSRTTAAPAPECWMHAIPRKTTAAFRFVDQEALGTHRERRKFPVVILRKSRVVTVLCHIWSTNRCQVPSSDYTTAFCCSFISVGTLPPRVHVLLRVGAVRVDSFFKKKKLNIWFLLGAFCN